jgi:hypothetical protein
MANAPKPPDRTPSSVRNPAHLAGSGRSRGQAVPLHSSLTLRVGPSVSTFRTLVATVLWALAVTAAVVLLVAALLVAGGADPDARVVGTVLDVAHRIDGPFGGLFTFYGATVDGVRGAPDAVKSALANWGLAAATYLVVGRILERVIRPSTRH